MTKRFVEYVSLYEALKILKRETRASPKRETVPIGQSYRRILCEDVVSARNIPERDSAHMDGYAVRISDLDHASEKNPVKLRFVKGSPLGVVPRRPLGKGEARTILTGGFLPQGADAVVQVERTTRSGRGVLFTRTPSAGEFIYPAGRDVAKGDIVAHEGRSLTGPDVVLLGSLRVAKVSVYAKPRVAILPTGNELTEDIRDERPGKVYETHSYLLSRLVEGAGGVPVLMPVAEDRTHDIAASLRSALKTSDLVLTLAGSSVGEADLTETAIDAVGKPGVLVHGMKVHRGRVMGFGVIDRKAVIIMPGPIQGAANAFIVMVYPLIRSLLGHGFESPPSIPAVLDNDWDAGERYPNFTKVVYLKVDMRGPEVAARASMGETEKMTFLAQNDGYMLVGEETTSLKKGAAVRVYLLPGLWPY